MNECLNKKAASGLISLFCTHYLPNPHPVDYFFSSSLSPLKSYPSRSNEAESGNSDIKISSKEIGLETKKFQTVHIDKPLEEEEENGERERRRRKKHPQILKNKTHKKRALRK